MQGLPPIFARLLTDTPIARCGRHHEATKPAQTASHSAAGSASCLHLPPGPSDAAHEATVRVLAQGMLDLGLLNKNKVGSVDGPSCPELGVHPPVPSPWRHGLA